MSLIIIQKIDELWRPFCRSRYRERGGEQKKKQVADDSELLVMSGLSLTSAATWEEEEVGIPLKQHNFYLSCQALFVLIICLKIPEEMRETWQRWNKWKPPCRGHHRFSFLPNKLHKKKERLVKYIDDWWKPISTGRILVPPYWHDAGWLCVSLTTSLQKSIKTHLATEQTSSGLGKTTKKRTKIQFQDFRKTKIK